MAELTVGVFPGCEPRLLRELPVPESLGSYRAGGGYGGLTDPNALLDVIAESGLLGRGGAAFPLAVKMRAVRDSCVGGVLPVAVANGEEGEPASVKDRWLLRHRPHLVLDGLRLAAHVIDADRAVVYVSDPAATRAVSDAVAELSSDVLVEIKTVDPGYVAGEETAAVRAINGGPAKPTDKPPRPFEEGVDLRPTLVSNVETLANLPFLLRHGASAFRSVGTATSPGTFLATVNRTGAVPGLYEVPHGTPLTELLAVHGISPHDVRGALMGGYFAGLLNHRVLDATLDHETLRGMGAGLGCGAICVLTDDDCPVAVAASVMRYFDRENAGQCGSCFNGTAAMSAVLDALCDGNVEDSDLQRLARWSVFLRSRGACGTLDGATNLARSLLAEFPDAVPLHRRAGCVSCATNPVVTDRPFEVESVSPV